MTHLLENSEIFFQMEPEHKPNISLIVSPLRALMMDQVAKLKGRGIKAVAALRRDEMTDEDIKGIVEVNINLGTIAHPGQTPL